jgi:hypothetical protein
MIEVFDKTYPQDYLDGLHNFYLGGRIQWTFLKDCAYGDDAEERGGTIEIPSFSSVPMGNKQIKDPETLKAWSLAIYLNQDLFGLEALDLFRLRIGMQLPLLMLEKPLHHNPHTDSPEEHMTVLLYLTDTDGDTFFFDDDGDIVERVTPKLGRAVKFNGNHIHASSSPTNGTRIAANFNYLVDGKDKLPPL